MLFAKPDATEEEIINALKAANAWNFINMTEKGLDTMAGVIDSPYRGEVKVLLVNHDEDYQVYSPGDKIAQIIIQQAPDFTPVAVDNLNETSRGENGFGSSGS